MNSNVAWVLIFVGMMVTIAAIYALIWLLIF